MSKIDAKSLLEKYKSDSLSDSERRFLEIWYAKEAEERVLNLAEDELSKNLDDVWNNISSVTKPAKTVVLWKRFAIAAAIILVGGLSIFFYQTEVKTTPKVQEQLANDIKPGGNRATLTLENGQVIALDDVANGKVTEQGGIIITKTKDGQLTYTVKSENGAEPKFNTISTPKGGQYQINLPDGSKVWLNAASSLKYPTFFTGKQRKVVLTGEAYFEVAKLADRIAKPMPFIVSTTNQEVTVLGTHFNINAYTNEDVLKTTLLEGAVKVTTFKKDNIQTVTLKPGQQSQFGWHTLKVEEVDATEAVAWKNGVFLFKDADLKTVMRSVSRWYDVEVVYEGQLPYLTFSGEIHRNLTLNQVFEILSFYKVHFRVEGKLIIVSR